VINDGSAKPYRLSISGSATGAAGNMKIDLSALGLDTTVMSKAQDACILYGDPDGGTSLMIQSKTNTFSNIIPGASITINGTSSTPINVWTEDSPADIKNSLKTFVENYNKLKKFLNENTLIDVNQNVKGLLAQDTTLLALERDMNELLLKSFSNLGPIRTLADVGVKMVPVSQLLNQEEGSTDAENANATTQAMLNAGLLEFDESVFDRLYESNPAAIKEFFAKTQELLDDKGELITKQAGYSSMFENLYQVYAYDPETSALNSKYNAMDRQILNNEQRLAFMDGRLEAKRAMLLKKFYAMEQAMARMQSDMSYINKMNTDMGNSAA
jgi:flagellar hook-associated protein 2